MDLKKIKRVIEQAIKNLESIDYTALTYQTKVSNNIKVQKAYDALFNLNSKIEKEIDKENNNKSDAEICMNNLEKFNNSMPSVEDMFKYHTPYIE